MGITMVRFNCCVLLVILFFNKALCESENGYVSSGTSIFPNIQNKTESKTSPKITKIQAVPLSKENTASTSANKGASLQQILSRLKMATSGLLHSARQLLGLKGQKQKPQRNKGKSGPNEFESVSRIEINKTPIDMLLDSSEEQLLELDGISEIKLNDPSELRIPFGGSLLGGRRFGEFPLGGQMLVVPVDSVESDLTQMYGELGRLLEKLQSQSFDRMGPGSFGDRRRPEWDMYDVFKRPPTYAPVGKGPQNAFGWRGPRPSSKLSDGTEKEGNGNYKKKPVSIFRVPITDGASEPKKQPTFESTGKMPGVANGSRPGPVRVQVPVTDGTSEPKKQPTNESTGKRPGFANGSGSGPVVVQEPVTGWASEPKKQPTIESTGKIPNTANGSGSGSVNVQVPVSNETSEPKKQPTTESTGKIPINANGSGSGPVNVQVPVTGWVSEPKKQPSIEFSGKIPSTANGSESGPVNVQVPVTGWASVPKKQPIIESTGKIPSTANGSGSGPVNVVPVTGWTNEPKKQPIIESIGKMPPFADGSGAGPVGVQVPVTDGTSKPKKTSLN